MNRQEQVLQQAMIKWFDIAHSDRILLLHYNLANAHSRTQGGINKSMGLRTGRSDLSYFYKGKTYFIEVKTKKGTMSKSQKAFMEAVVDHGFAYYVVRSLDDFMDLIKLIHGVEG